MAVFRVGRLDGGSSLGGGDYLSALASVVAVVDTLSLDHASVVALVASLAAADTGGVAATDAGLDEALPELYFIGSAGFATAIGGPRSVALVGGDPNA